MEINWYGHSCFKLKDRNLTVVCDPFDKSLGLALPRLKADIVTISHSAPGHSSVEGVKDWRKVFSGPGEYEVEGTFITGIATFHGKDEHDAADPNTVFIFEFPEMTVAHLGDLGHVLTESQVEAMPDIDVLLVPVGGRYTLDAAAAAEVIGIIEPRIVIPMHYRMEGVSDYLDPLDRFLKEMGVPTPEAVGTLRLTKAQLPEETQVMIMDIRS